jgi:DNA-binding beta-propeller fold protein YncE
MVPCAQEGHVRYGVGDFQYELVDDWARVPPGWSFVDVGGVGIDTSDSVYVLNRSDKPVVVFSRDGEWLRDWGEGYFLRAHGCRIVRDGPVYCTDDGHHVVASFTPQGELLMQLGEKGCPSDTGYTRTWEVWQSTSTVARGAPPFNRPTGVAVTQEGDLFVSDGYGNSRIHRFNADGTLRASWGEPGGEPGKFRLPHDIVLDSKGRLIVADRENSRLQLFDLEGNLLGIWHDVIRPTGLFVDGQGYVYVSELCLRVSVFDADGRLVTRWGNPSPVREEALFLAPHAVAVDSRGDVYVGEVASTYAKTDKGPRTIQKFARVR